MPQRRRASRVRGDGGRRLRVHPAAAHALQRLLTWRVFLCILLAQACQQRPHAARIVRHCGGECKYRATTMPKRARDDAARRPPKRARGAHQRHRTKLVNALGEAPASGIFMSCARGKERKAGDDLIAILADHADVLYKDVPLVSADEDDMDALRNGPPPPVRTREPARADDIEAQISGELRELAEPSAPRFTVLDTETECLCYVRCAPPLDALRLVGAAAAEVAATGDARSRYVQRLSPVAGLCHADLDSIRAYAARILPRYISGTQTFRIEPRIRAHTAITRDDVISAVASCVPPGHTTDLVRPDVVVLVEVFRNVCGIGVVADYEQHGRLNLQTLAERKRAADLQVGRAPRT